MRLTTKGRFAVTALLDLALSQKSGPGALASISDRRGISLSYLEQLFGKLRRNALVTSVRGPGGGYLLARSVDEVSVADIIRAVNEPMDATQCGGKENCHDDHKCLTHDLWAGLNDCIEEYLSSIKLGELVARERAAAVRIVDMRGNRRVGGSITV